MFEEGCPYSSSPSPVKKNEHTADRMETAGLLFGISACLSSSRPIRVHTEYVGLSHHSRSWQDHRELIFRLSDRPYTWNPYDDKTSFG